MACLMSVTLHQVGYNNMETTKGSCNKGMISSHCLGVGGSIPLVVLPTIRIFCLLLSHYAHTLKYYNKSSIFLVKI